MALVGILSDIHSNLPALKAVLEELERLGPDLIISAGDLVGYYTFPNEVIKMVRMKGIYSIKGNHDRAVLSGDVSWFNEDAAEAALWNRARLSPASMEFLAQLPDRWMLEVGGKNVLIVHGSPRDPDEYVLPLPPGRWPFGTNDADLIVMGHTHIAWTERYGELTVLNPGGVGQPRDGDPRPAFALVDTRSMVVRLLRASYDPAETAWSVLEHGLPPSLAVRLYHGL
ncbi:MAG: YfcE family phosphodiesterase [Thermoplasmata archaeon]